MRLLSRAKEWSKDFISDSYHSLVGCGGTYASLKYDTSLVTESSLTKEDCASFIQEIDQILCAEEKVSGYWSDELESDQRIFGFEDLSPSVFEALEVEKEIGEIQQYLGRGIRSWTLMASRVRFKERNIGSGGGWHRDSPYSHQVKIIWYLNNVTVKQGPFLYVAGTHFRSATDPREWEYNNRIKDINDRSALPVVGSAGIKLVCDTKCVHKGAPIEEGVRYSITLYTFHSLNGKNALISRL